MLLGMIQHHWLCLTYMPLKRVQRLRQFGFLQKIIPQHGTAMFETFL